MATKTKRLLVVADHEALLTVLADFQRQFAPDLVFRTAMTVDDALGLLAIDAADTIVLGLIQGEDEDALETRVGKVKTACPSAEIIRFNPRAIENRNHVIDFFRTFALCGHHTMSLLEVR